MAFPMPRRSRLETEQGKLTNRGNHPLRTHGQAPVHMDVRWMGEPIFCLEPVLCARFFP